MFKREQENTLAAIEAWVRGHVPAVVLTSIVTIVVVAGLGHLLYQPISASFQTLIGLREASLNEAIAGIERASTRKFLMTARRQEVPSTDSNPVLAGSSLSTEQSVQIDWQNCSLNVTKDQIDEVTRAGAPSRLQTKRSAENIPLARVGSLAFLREDHRNAYLMDDNTTIIFFDIRGMAIQATEQILEIERVQRFVSTSSVRLHVYSHDFHKLGEQILLLLRRCGAREIFYHDGVNPDLTIR